MATAAFIPVSEYLSTGYEPDCDYIEGELQERNVGETHHSYLQFIVAAIFNRNRLAWNVVAGTEMRVQVAPDRFRIPDVTVQRRSDPRDPIVHVAPLLCVEILSPEDRIARMNERFADYFSMGVEHVWFIDPLARQAWIATPDGSSQRAMQELAIPGTPVRVSLPELFTELDAMLSRD